MSNGLSYEQVVELLPAYTLGALEPDELLAVEDYLEQQRALLTRVERLHSATAQLAYAAPTAPLSPQIKATLLARVRVEATPSVQAAAAQRSAPSRVRPPVMASGALPARNPLVAGRNPAARTPPRELPRSRPVQPPLPAPQPRRFNFGWLAAAAMAVAAFLIIWIDIGVQRQLTQLQAELAARDTQLTELSQQLQTMQEQLRQEQQQFAFLAGCASNLVALNGTAVDPDAGGIFCQQDEEAFLVLHGLSPLPATHTYQLWLIPSDGAPVSAGLLRVESAAIARQQVPLTADPLTYTAVGISIEPAGGSEEPTGDQIVLLGEKT